MKKKIMIITSMIIAVMIIIIVSVYYHKKNLALAAAKKTEPVLVRVEKPIQQSLSKTAFATGYLVAKNSVTITSQTSGYIQSIRVHEGEVVKSGQILFQLDARAEKAALIAAQANYSLSQLQYEQNKKLLKKGYITHDALYTMQATVKQNKAALETAKTNLSNCTITAPFDGIVGALPVSLGDYVIPSNTLTTLVDNKQLRVEYALPVNYLDQLKLNQIVTITDATRKNKIAATVSYIASVVDQSTQTISVHAHINNTAQLFKPGEYVTIAQNLGMQKNTVLVPEQSVISSINGYHVFIVRNNKAIKVPVKIGEHMNGNVVITSGLTANDEVLIAGENEVKDGMDVKKNN